MTHPHLNTFGVAAGLTSVDASRRGWESEGRACCPASAGALFFCLSKLSRCRKVCRGFTALVGASGDATQVVCSADGVVERRGELDAAENRRTLSSPLEEEEVARPLLLISFGIESRLAPFPPTSPVLTPARRCSLLVHLFRCQISGTGDEHHHKEP